jgi:hypothetical protein
MFSDSEVIFRSAVDAAVVTGGGGGGGGDVEAFGAGLAVKGLLVAVTVAVGVPGLRRP